VAGSGREIQEKIFNFICVIIGGVHLKINALTVKELLRGQDIPPTSRRLSLRSGDIEERSN
jgi:hypothetical protein